MRRDLIKELNSSFLSCEKDTELILKKLFVESRIYSDLLKKLLIVNTKDCLEDKVEYKKKIDEFNLSDLHEQGYIRLSPKIEFGEHEEVKSYILISFDNFIPNKDNPEFRDCMVTFDIICHTDCWDMNNFQLRPIKIAGYIDGLLNGSKLTGIGEFQFAGLNELILDSNLSGYTLMYKAVHSVDGDDKIPDLPEVITLTS